MQRGFAANGGRIFVGVVLQEVDDDLVAPDKRSNVQTGQSRFRFRFDVGPVGEEQFDQFQAILLAGDVQAGKAIQRLGIDIGTTFAEKLADVVITTMWGHMKGREIILIGKERQKMINERQ